MLNLSVQLPHLDATFSDLKHLDTLQKLNLHDVHVPDGLQSLVTVLPLLVRLQDLRFSIVRDSNITSSDTVLSWFESLSELKIRKLVLVLQPSLLTKNWHTAELIRTLGAMPRLEHFHFDTNQHDQDVSDCFSTALVVRMNLYTFFKPPVNKEVISHCVDDKNGKRIYPQTHSLKLYACAFSAQDAKDLCRMTNLRTIHLQLTITESMAHSLKQISQLVNLKDLKLYCFEAWSDRKEISRLEWLGCLPVSLVAICLQFEPTEQILPAKVLQPYREFGDCLPFFGRLKHLKTLYLCMGGTISAQHISLLSHLPLRALCLACDAHALKSGFVFSIDSPALLTSFCEIKTLKRIILGETEIPCHLPLLPEAFHAELQRLMKFTSCVRVASDSDELPWKECTTKITKHAASGW